VIRRDLASILRREGREEEEGEATSERSRALGAGLLGLGSVVAAEVLEVVGDRSIEFLARDGRRTPEDEERWAAASERVPVEGTAGLLGDRSSPQDARSVSKVCRRARWQVLGWELATMRLLESTWTKARLR
jgi:hypothetical protein